MDKRSQTGSTAGWLIVSAGLLGLIVFQANNDISLTLPVTAAPAPEAPLDAEAGAEDLALLGPDFDALDAIVERPLFSASRRPFVGAEEDEPESAPALDDEVTLTLAGTLLAGEARFALLLHPDKGLLRLREGQEVDGWSIAEIGVRDVRLERDDETAQLILQKGVPKPAGSRAKGRRDAAEEKNAADAAASVPQD